MWMSDNDLFEITLRGTILDTVFNTVLQYWLHFESGTGLVNPVTVMQAFYDSMITPLQDVVVTDCVYRQIALQGITEEDSFGVMDFTVAGGLTGDAAPSYLALGIKKAVSSKSTRPGSLRQPGLRLADISDNDYTNVSNAAAIVACYDQVVAGSEVTPAIDFECWPIIVGRADDGQYDPARWNNITGWSVGRLTTQSSRKYWRGI